jgi:hypothetical protein
MPFPGLESRPDRIYFQESNFIKQKNIKVIGDGTLYRKNYYWKTIFQRFKNEFSSFFNELKIFICYSFCTLWIIYICNIFKKLYVLFILIIIIILRKTVFNYMEEEFYPSDHQAVIASFILN